MQERFKTFTVLMAKINRSIRKIKTEEMAEFNLKSPHVSCLYYLYKAENLTAKELCDICEEDKANISRSIVYLETNGYITCECTAQKRYKSPLVLTEKGREVAQKVTEKIDNKLLFAGDGLDEASREIMYQSLAIVADNLQKICDGYGEK